MLGLIKHFFDCGLIKAFVIAIITVVDAVVILSLLGHPDIDIDIGTWVSSPVSFFLF